MGICCPKSENHRTHNPPILDSGQYDQDVNIKDNLFFRILHLKEEK